MKTLLLIVLLSIYSTQGVMAGSKDAYYLAYSTPDGQYVKWGPMRTLHACQEEMAIFLGKFGNRIINPVCIKENK